MQNYPDSIVERIENGEIAKQKSWSFIQELNSYSEERLNAVALIDGSREYSYRQMFRHCDLYAEVFSALGISEAAGSRVGIVAFAALEPLISFYALNKMGVSVSMLHIFDSPEDDRFRLTMEKEGITDLLLSDGFVDAVQIKAIIRQKRDLGLEHIIILHAPICGPLTTPAMRQRASGKYQELKLIRGVLFMDDLLVKYEAMPIASGSGRQDEAAVIVHTSGTTSGIHKPVPHSDRGLNEAVLRMLQMKEFEALRGKVVTWLNLPPSACYSMIDMIHLPLAFGGTIVTIPDGFDNPMAFDTIKRYRVNVLFVSAAMSAVLFRIPIRPDLSSITTVLFGGEYISPEKKAKFDDYLRSCGAQASISVGYGLSEAGAACMLAPPDLNDGSMGSLMPGVKAKIYVEDEDRYHDFSEGPRVGVLFLSSHSLSGGKIGDQVFFKLDEIDGEQYLNTHDVVEIKEDGRVEYIGRMNKYFVNNDGVRFDAGLVETSVAKETGILQCGLVPKYDKNIQDTVPSLYIRTEKPGPEGVRAVKNALIKVFITDNNIEKTNLPAQCILCEDLPINDSGKVDTFRIGREHIPGMLYVIEPVRIEGKLKDIRLRPENADNPRAMAVPGMLYALPQELEGDFKSKGKPFFAPSEPGEISRFVTEPADCLCRMLRGLFLCDCNPAQYEKELER